MNKLIHFQPRPKIEVPVIDIDDNLHQIRSSVDRINAIMAELKKLTLPLKELKGNTNVDKEENKL